jgi:hypothetical protein
MIPCSAARSGPFLETSLERYSRAVGRRATLPDSSQGEGAGIAIVVVKEGHAMSR